MFSDLSHLLTHVASKGHLSQHSKAKLRAHQDASFREKLEAFDRWYQRHQIERLLSERMIAKESKDSNTRNRTTKTDSRSVTSVKVNLPRRRRAKTLKRQEQNFSPVKNEGVIDPQLSRPDQATESADGSISSMPEQPSIEDDEGLEILPNPAARLNYINPSTFLNQPYHRNSLIAPVPHMSRWQALSSPPGTFLGKSPAENKEYRPSAKNEDTDCESDYFQTFLRSPTRSAYPDPSEVNDFGASFPIDSSSSAVKEKRETESDRHNVGISDEVLKMADSTLHSPVLRGVRWPGMSIFDSANLEAQRLRNQKKTGSIIELMEHNSAMVEQLERIYWPDGSLKAQRLITGDVESSPLKNSSPLPKLTKRSRAKTARPVLANLTTNVPNLRKKPRGRKGPARVPIVQASDLKSISHRALASMASHKHAYPRNAHTDYDAHKGEDQERSLTSRAILKTHHEPFDVFRDPDVREIDTPVDITQQTRHHAFAQPSRTRPPFWQSDSSVLNARNQTPSPTEFRGVESRPQKSARNSRLRGTSSQARSLFINDDSENIEPVLGSDGQVLNNLRIDNERSTQRYFTVTGNQPPQFFSSMPPSMDFGGLMEPKYHGSTLNPLNPYVRQRHFNNQQPLSNPFSQSRGPLENPRSSGHARP